MNENDMSIAFRSSFAGYNKDDVNNYIFNENRRFSSLEHSYLATIDDLRGDLARAKEEIARLSEISRSYDALSAKVLLTEAETGAKIEKLEKEREDFVAALSDSSSTIESLTGDVAAAVAERDNLKRTLSVCKDELAAANDKLTAAQKELDSRKSELSMAELSVNNYRARLDEEALAKNELNAKLEAAASEVESAKESVRSAMDDLTSYRAEFDSAKSELITVKTELSTVKCELTAAVTEYNTAKAELASVKSEYETCRAELLAAQNEAANAKAKLLLLQNEADTAKARARLFQENADSLKADLANARALDNSHIDTQAEIISQKLLDKAKDASEEMLRRAEEGTSFILEKARDEAAIYRTDMLNVTKDIISTVTDELLRSVDRCMNDFIRGIHNAGNASDTTSAEITRCGDEFSRRIERLQSELDRTIAAKLAEFDARHGQIR